MFAGRQPPGVEVEELIKRIQEDARDPLCPPGDPDFCEYNLKPCPFCGGNATLRRTPDGGAFIDCDDCQASSQLVYGDKTDPKALVAEAWNTRKD